MLGDEVKAGSRITFYGLYGMNREQSLNFIERSNDDELMWEGSIKYFDSGMGVMMVEL